MATKPQSRVKIDPTLEDLLKKLQTSSKEGGDAVTRGQQLKWFRPQGLAADPARDFDAVSTAFSRKKINENGIKAIENPESPGTSGDIVMAATMLGVMSTMERAFRVRHTLRRPRANALAAGRLKGHGNVKGPILQCYLEYLRALEAGAKS